MKYVFSRGLVVAAGLLLVGVDAHADPEGMPLAFVSRPLTLPAGMVRLDGNFDAHTNQVEVDSTVGGSSVLTPTTQTNSVLTLGAAYGITRDFEIAAEVPAQIGPDLVAQDPYFRGLYRFVQGRFEAAAQLDVSVPVQSGEGVGLGVGLPMLVRVSNVGRFDIVPRFGVDLASPVTKYVDVQAYYQHQIADGFTLGVHTAMEIPDVSQPDVVHVPVGIFGRLSLARADGNAYADVILGFDFDRLFNGGSGGPVDSSAYTIAMTGRLYLPL